MTSPRNYAGAKQPQRHTAKALLKSDYNINTTQSATCVGQTQTALETEWTWETRLTEGKS